LTTAIEHTVEDDTMTRHPWDPVQLKLAQKDVLAYQQLGEVVYEKADSVRPSSRKMIIFRKGKAIVEPDGIFCWKAFADYVT
jgi:hypothetical protein